MRNLLLSAALLLSSFGAIAQLYVEPNGATDSYVYVSDQVLFVEQDVNLTYNNAGTTEASIYLRDGAQLIQGTSSTANKGNGMVSVYQNAPESDQWTYNYWCSPISAMNAAIDGNLSFGVTRLHQIDGITDATRNIPTTGFNGSSTPSLRISNRWIYMKPRGWEAESDYVWAGDNNIISPGRGFTMKGVDANPVPVTGYNYDFRGRPNNGNINVNVFNGELTLTGNPYPSALDLNRVFYDTATGDANGTMNSGNDEIDQFYFWDEDKTVNSHYYRDNQGGYGTWIPGTSNPDGNTGDSGFQPGTYAPAPFSIWGAGGNTGGTMSMGGSYDRRFAPIGQGVLVLGASNGSITLKNSHRRYKLEGDNSDFRFREDPNTETGDGNRVPTLSEADNRIPQLRINAEFGNSHIRQTVLLFSENSTDEFDRGQDGRSPMDATSEMYFPVGLEQEKIDCVISTFPFRRVKQIPVSFMVDRQTQVVVKTVEEIKFGSKVAYLWDSEEHTFQQFSGEGGEAILNLEAGTYNDRFYVVFKTFRERQTEAQSKKEETLASVDVFQNNPVKQLEVGNPEGYEIESANIFDMSGKLVLSESNLGNNNRLTFPTGNLSEGIYVVMLTTNEGITIDYKITVRN